MEQEPLLPQSSNTTNSLSKREKVAKHLESHRLHRFIVALILIDAICVLADLSYTFLSDNCDNDNLPNESENNPLWLDILSHISLGITSLFLIEIPLTIYGFGLTYYNPFGQIIHSRLHLFDAFVILTTFILEVVLRGKERELAGLLIILRLWRLVKLVGGVAVGAGELTEETEKRLQQAEMDLQRTKELLQEAQDENERLKRVISSQVEVGS